MHTYMGSTEESPPTPQLRSTKESPQAKNLPQVPE